MRTLKLLSSILMNRAGAVPRPSWCTWLVTYRCNARCGMCDSWRVKPGNELTVIQAERVFAKLGRLDVVRLTGGEPFLREDFGELAEAVLRHSDPLIVHVTTNGSFPERAEALAHGFSQRRRLRFMVSLDGMADEHDANRGEVASFERALETVARLKSAGAQVSVNHTVISARSLADAEPLRRRLGALGVDVHSVLAYEGSAMYSLKLRGTRAEHLVPERGYPLHPALQNSDVVGFVEDEARACDDIHDRGTRLGKRYYLDGLRARLRGEAATGPRCVALRSHVRLMPDGRVPVCQFNTETVGDLSRQDFDSLWHGDAAIAARRWVDACTGCWAECEVIPSAIYSGDILRALTIAFPRAAGAREGRGGLSAKAQPRET